MSTIPIERHELKFLARPEELPAVISWINENNGYFRTEYPSRRVNSLYFDSCNYECCTDNLSGVGERAKARMRWYGEQIDQINAKFEIKMKTAAGLGFKKIHPLEGILDFSASTYQHTMNIIRLNVSCEDRIWLDKYPQPTLISSYKREYFTSKRENIRITLDRDLKFYRQHSVTTPNVNRHFSFKDIIVVEVKYPPELGYIASQIISEIPLRRTRFSKYVTGILTSD